MNSATKLGFRVMWFRLWGWGLGYSGYPGLQSRFCYPTILSLKMIATIMTTVINAVSPPDDSNNHNDCK